MTLAASLVELSDVLFELLGQTKEALGVEDVYYGDQDLIPRRPTITLEPLSVDRSLAGIGGQGVTENTYGYYITIYHGTYRDVQQSRRDADAMTADVEALLHKDTTLGGSVIHGFVTRTESGQARRGEVLSATRLTYEAKTKTILGV